MFFEPEEGTMALVIAKRAPGVELADGSWLAVGQPAVNADVSGGHNLALLNQGLIALENADAPTPPVDSPYRNSQRRTFLGLSQPPSMNRPGDLLVVPGSEESRGLVRERQADGSLTTRAEFVDGAEFDAQFDGIEPGEAVTVDGDGKPSSLGPVVTDSKAGVVNPTHADYGAVGDGVRVTDATMTASSATLHTASYVFITADIGKLVSVKGAGAAGADLTTTIASVSAGDAVLDDAASTTVSSVRAMWATDDTEAIQAAMTAAGNPDSTIFAGGSVFLPKPPNGAFYGLSDALVIGKWVGFRMFGVGRDISTLCQFTNDTPVVKFDTALTRNIELDHFGLIYAQQQTSAMTGGVALAYDVEDANGTYYQHVHDLQIEKAYIGVGNIASTANVCVVWGSKFADILFREITGGLFKLVPASGAGTNGQPNVVIDNITVLNDDATGDAVAQTSTLPAVWTQGEIRGTNWDIEGWASPILRHDGSNGWTKLSNLHIERYALATGVANAPFSTVNDVGTPYLSLEQIHFLNMTLTGGGDWYLVRSDGRVKIDGVLAQLGTGSAGLGGNFAIYLHGSGGGQVTLDNYVFGTDGAGVTTSKFPVYPFSPYTAAAAVRRLSGGVPATSELLSNSGGTLPTPSSSWRNKRLVVSGNGTTRGDVEYICRQNAAGTYVWTQVGARSGLWLPDNSGLIGWSFDPLYCGGSTAPTAGKEYVIQVPVEIGRTIASVKVCVGTAGSGGTSLANCFFGVRNAAGTLLGQSADASAALASTDEQTIAITAESGQSLVTVQPYVYVCFVIGTQSSTPVALFRGGAAAASLANIGHSAAPYRSANYGTGLTSLASSRDYTSSPSVAAGYFVAVA